MTELRNVRIINGTQVIMASTAPKINAAAMPCPVRPMTIPVNTMMPEPMICPIASPIQSEIFNFYDLPHTFSSLFLPMYSRFCWRIPTETHNILFFYSTEISSFVNLQNAQGLTLYLYRIDNIIIELVSL